MPKAARWTALLLIAFYRQFLSGIFGGSCRFHPTCSCYAQQAFSQKPVGEAFRLTLRRLSKCHPWGPFGYDPIPLSRVEKEVSR